jgi:uncharacterized membrane protein
MTALPSVPAASNTQASGTNRDGSVIVGYAYTPTGAVGLSWDASGVSVLASEEDAYPFGVSSDGKVPVGQARFDHVYHAVRWVSGVIQDLGDVPGGSDSSYGWAANRDGSVVVGYSDNGTSSGAMVWDKGHGMRSIADVLSGAGIDVSDWYLQNAYGVSDDGKVVGGTGYRISTGRNEGWVAHLP